MLPPSFSFFCRRVTAGRGRVLFKPNPKPAAVTSPGVQRHRTTNAVNNFFFFFVLTGALRRFTPRAPVFVDLPSLSGSVRRARYVGHIVVTERGQVSRQSSGGERGRDSLFFFFFFLILSSFSFFPVF